MYRVLHTDPVLQYAPPFLLGVQRKRAPPHYAQAGQSHDEPRRVEARAASMVLTGAPHSPQLEHGQAVRRELLL